LGFAPLSSIMSFIGQYHPHPGLSLAVNYIQHLLQDTLIIINFTDSHAL